MDNTVPSGGQRSLQQPVSQPTEPQIVSTPPVPSVSTGSDEEKKQSNQQIGGPGKEFGPMASISPGEQGGQVENDDDEDEIKVARQEVMLGQNVSPVQEVPVSQELKEAGIEQGTDTEKEVPVIVQRAGVRTTSADSAVPVSVAPSIKLPITYAHALQLDKRSKIKESIKWLARFIKRQWEKVKLTEGQKTEV